MESRMTLLHSSCYTHLFIFVHSMIHNREEPGSSLQSVGTTWLEIQSTETPVLQFTNKVLGTHTLCQVKLSFPVESQNVLEYARRSVKIEFSVDQTE